jgi:hypothetical protein
MPGNMVSDTATVSAEIVTLSPYFYMFIYSEYLKKPNCRLYNPDSRKGAVKRGTLKTSPEFG